MIRGSTYSITVAGHPLSLLLQLKLPLFLKSLPSFLLTLSDHIFFYLSHVIALHPSYSFSFGLSFSHFFLPIFVPYTFFTVGANSRASKSWVDSMVKQVLGNLQRGATLAQAGGMSNGMVSSGHVRKWWVKIKSHDYVGKNRIALGEKWLTITFNPFHLLCWCARTKHILSIPTIWIRAIKQRKIRMYE